jgi:hypothetical protein
MRALLRTLVFAVLFSQLAVIGAWAAQAGCPDRPQPGTPVNYPLDLYSQNGVLSLDLRSRTGPSRITLARCTPSIFIRSTSW